MAWFLRLILCFGCMCLMRVVRELSLRESWVLESSVVWRDRFPSQKDSVMKRCSFDLAGTGSLVSCPGKCYIERILKYLEICVCFLKISSCNCSVLQWTKISAFWFPYFSDACFHLLTSKSPQGSFSYFPLPHMVSALNCWHSFQPPALLHNLAVTSSNSPILLLCFAASFKSLHLHPPETKIFKSLH